MKCLKCGSEIPEGKKFCSECGAPVESSPVNQETPVTPNYQNPVSKPPKKKGGCLKGGLIVLGIFVAIGIIGTIAGGGGDAASASASQAPSSSPNAVVSEKAPASEPAKETPKAEPYSVELGSGHYTAGVDIPAGTYNITAVKGGGNVSSTNMYSGGLNAVMGVGKSDMYTKEFKNLKLPNGESLSVSGVTIKLTSSAVDKSSVKKRDGNTAKEITLSAGNYVSGTNFKSGTYDITLVKGTGNVSSDNMFDGGLNVIMGGGTDMSIQNFKNATFEDGNTLTISGVTIKMTPSK